MNSIALDAQGEGIPLWDRDISRYIYSNRIPVFNPLEDFLYHLPVWDGKDRIRGLRMGADDYLSKPFQIGELLARVETVLRRTKRIQDKITIDDVTLDPVSRQVFKDGHQINLTVKEFDLLMELVGNKNVALSRARLYEAVWEEEYSGETRTLDSHIQRLRKKLDWNDRIVTVFRIGYRLEVHQ